ncbi:uncharacterized protein LOC111292567 [Durio zibethinus]|uniref:Uncharacterized protein LOC111292567 n=1 Tax=Durio zibethinus TaxID=66656 RepID=A0A6P5YJP2_DURZI|nr:uncharacterized protein LOC111292567 [Durio zibethinus]
MAALSEFFSRLYTMTIVFFTLLVLEVVMLIRSITCGVCDSGKRLITTTQYLKFIEEKNPTIRYSRRSSRVDDQSNECAVCLSELEEGETVRKLKCKHTFHKDCLDRWLQQYRATCPLCRTKVLPDEIVAKYHSHRLQDQVEYDESDEEMIFLLSALHGLLSFNNLLWLTEAQILGKVFNLMKIEHLGFNVLVPNSLDWKMNREFCTVPNCQYLVLGMKIYERGVEALMQFLTLINKQCKAFKQIPS